MTFTVDIGVARVRQLTELARWPFSVTGLFPAVDERAAAALPPQFVDPESGDLILAIHTYVIDIGETMLVVDTGNGNHKERPNLLPHHMFDADWEERFAATGHSPADVDLVVSTHLHPDHCGWNTRLVDEAWVPTFERATYVYGAVELAGLQALVASPAPNSVVSDLVRTYHDSIRPILEQATWITADDDHILAEEGDTRVVLRSGPGHTAGHQIVEFCSPDRSAVISGDVVHHPIQFCCALLVQEGDADPLAARRTCDTLLERCAREGLLLMPAHFPMEAPVVVSLGEAGRPSAPALLVLPTTTHPLHVIAYSG
ncbi:MBL fold metallo-hydrolase [Nocardia sienata]|uniref:MBL fold metallo-hydrolase n=1 Tax=Nocardia sienata TaxID=248552 RepID=UPI0007A41663|nr:MBL fold metallo-hydrolase [Nocardia sienata]